MKSYADLVEWAGAERIAQVQRECPFDLVKDQYGAVVWMGRRLKQIQQYETSVPDVV